MEEALVRDHCREMPEDLAALASFVPALMLRRIASSSEPILQPASECISACVLFADISGFTTLAERLAKGGPEGAETLSSILNMYFEKLVAVIYAHGGDVVKFAGDGLLALWTDSEGLATATLRAAQCALAIIAELHEFEVIEGVRLSLHIGIGAGEVSIFRLGGILGRWELLYSGKPFVQLCPSTQLAKPGRAILSPEAWALVNESCTGTLLPSGCCELGGVIASVALTPTCIPPPPPGASETLPAFVPHAMIHRMSMGQGAWLAELRCVTVLFVNLPEFSDAVSLDRAQLIAQTIQRLLYHYEGSLGEIGVDDKGISLVAALGLAPFAHEDDPLRGIQAAQAIQAGLLELGVRSAIGVTSGRVFCGPVGGPLRRQYTMIGDIVNVAARLMQAAPADILCDGTTYRSAKTHLQMEVLPPIAVKGKREPISVYRPYRSAALSGAEREMVGRRAECTQLLDKIKGLCRGEGGLAMIEGEPGIGKSRLIAYLKQEAGSLNAAVLTGAGDAIEKATPHYAWRHVFEQVFGLESVTDPKLRREQVLQRLGTQADWLRVAPLINSVLPLDLPENDITEHMTGEVRADNTNKLLREILEAEANRHACILIIEDAHWLDSASWSLITVVIQRVARLLVILTTRPVAQPIPPAYGPFLQDPRLTRIFLAPLPAENVTALVAQRLGVASLPPTVAAFIQEKAQGNPFFSEELAYALRDSGVLLISNSQCEIGANIELNNVTCPDSVQGVITSRMDKLDASQQLTLKIGSVIGRVFALRILKDIYPIQPEREMLISCLAGLEKLNLTSTERQEPDSAYIFKHVITQEVAYNLLLFAQRRQLHRQVAEWYEKTQENDLSPFYASLAHHWTRAQETEKAIEYLEKAGEQALVRGAYREAIGFLSELLVLGRTASVPGSAGHDLREAGWEQRLGLSYVNLGNLQKSGEHTRRALVLVRCPLPEKKLVLFSSFILQVFVQLAHLCTRRWWRWGGTEESRERFGLASKCYERIGHLCYFASNRVGAVYAALRGLNLAERGARSGELVRAYSTMAVAAGVLGLHRLGARYCRCAETLSCGDDVLGRTWMLELTGMFWSSLGQWGKADEKLGQAVTVSRTIGDWRRWQESLIQLSIVNLQRGKFALAEEEGSEVYSMAQGEGNEQAQSWALSVQSTARLRLGDIDQALKLSEMAALLPEEKIGTTEAIWIYGGLAVARWRKGNVQMAREAVQKATRLIYHSRSMSNFDQEAYSGVCETLLGFLMDSLRAKSAERGALDREAAKACGILKRFAYMFPPARPRAMIWSGLMNWCRGRERRAFRAWEIAHGSAEGMEMPYDAGLALFEIGRHQAPTDSRRIQNLAAACEIFEKLGARYDIDRTRKEMSAISPHV
jgi:class 3 adenylate cyclase/tetratricopeptide (TPR) repeat protein